MGQTGRVAPQQIKDQGQAKLQAEYHATPSERNPAGLPLKSKEGMDPGHIE